MVGRGWLENGPGNAEGGLGADENGGVGRHVQKQGMLDAAANGVKVVNVSPLRSDVLDEMDADWFAIYPEIKLVYWAGGNPFHHQQDLVRLRRAWQKPDTVIVHEWCWNAQAKHADIVLPAATFLERNDIASSSRDPFLIYMQKAAEPVGLSITDYEIFSELAQELGAREAFTEGRDEGQWLNMIYVRIPANVNAHSG